MRHSIKAALTSLMAVAAATAFASSAGAATGINISAPASGTLVASNLTLTDPAISTVVSNLTLDYDSVVIGATDCARLTQLKQIATIDGGNMQVLSPAGATAVLLFATPWTVSIRCHDGNVQLTGGDLVLWLLNVQFQVNLNAISRPLYQGSVSATLNGTGTTLTLAGSNLTSLPNRTAGTLAGRFALSPAIRYTLIP